jgi:hypothetical protein
LREQKQGGVWADHVMILGVARCYGLKIKVWGTHGEIVIKGEEVEIRRKVDVGFVDGVHYFEVVSRNRVEKVGGEGNKEEGTRADEQRKQIPYLDITEGFEGLFDLGMQGLTEDMRKV